MKKLFYLFVALVIAFFVSSVFKGGDYIRLISVKTGVSLGPLESIADSLSLGDFMSDHSRSVKSKEQKRIGQ
jgi:hypothetical protein